MNDQDMPVPTFGALILTGGRSSRMGADKAALPFRGATLLTHMRDTAIRAGAITVLTGGGPGGNLADPVADAGPAASLCALGRHIAGGGAPDRWTVIPVDMPRLGPSPLSRLAHHQAHAAFFESHPLPLALTVNAAAIAILAKVENRLKAGDSISIRQVLAMLDATALAVTSGEHPQLTNANTPEDWRQVLEEEK